MFIFSLLSWYTGVAYIIRSEYQFLNVKKYPPVALIWYDIIADFALRTTELRFLTPGVCCWCSKVIVFLTQWSM